jgi:hypothetical protein
MLICNAIGMLLDVIKAERQCFRTGEAGEKGSMNLFFYSTETGGQLQRLVEALVPEEKVEVYRTIRRLSERFYLPRHSMSVAVLHARSKRELVDIVSLGHLFDDVRIILILPDRKEETIALGHRLRPRFLTFGDDDFTEVLGVLGKMLGHDKDIP